ncbi:MAG: branched-chain amino acid ABC transporter permease [Acetobacteraceae bacterium]|nr:branched-chain amino acid ABC transporter permease [Acetobacteraceae bacterium]
MARKHGWRAGELLLPLALATVPVLGPQYYALATQAAIVSLFVLSLDLLVGYAGIVTLGHGLFFGLGAYAAGIASVRGWGEPLTGLAIGGSTAALVGAGLGAIVLRTARFTLLMLTLCAVFLGNAVANRATWLTGGADGLVGVTTWPLLGRFEFDLFGRTGYAYAAAVLVLVWVGLHWLVHAPFGQSVQAIRDNPERAAALGMAVLPRLTLVFAISAGLAGLAGALQAETDQFAGLKDMSFEFSAEALVILALGGAGRLYGAVIGSAAYLIGQDLLAKQNPALWQLWLGTLIVAVVLFAPGGLLGLRLRSGR